jgi:hypothetical protein
VKLGRSGQVVSLPAMLKMGFQIVECWLGGHRNTSRLGSLERSCPMTAEQSGDTSAEDRQNPYAHPLRSDPAIASKVLAEIELTQPGQITDAFERSRTGTSRTIVTHITGVAPRLSALGRHARRPGAACELPKSTT